MKGTLPAGPPEEANLGPQQPRTLGGAQRYILCKVQRVQPGLKLTLDVRGQVWFPGTWHQQRVARGARYGIYHGPGRNGKTDDLRNARFYATQHLLMEN